MSQSTVMSPSASPAAPVAEAVTEGAEGQSVALPGTATETTPAAAAIPSPPTGAAVRRFRVSTQDVSVVVPTLNEGGNIEELLSGLRAMLGSLGARYEIIVVDAGSTDDSVARAEAGGAQVHVQRRKGYGAALLEGFARATGEYVLTMDADLSHNPSVVRRLFRARERADILIASRYVRGGYARMPLGRLLLSRMLNRVYAQVLDLPIRDLSSGFRLYRRRVLERLDLEQTDFSLLEEILVKAYAEGYSVEEVPFHYHPRKDGSSKAKIFACGVSCFKLLLRLRRLRNSVSSADYDERAFYSRILPQRWWQRSRYKVITGFLEPSGSILDVGCGSSKILESIPCGVGVDILQRKLRYRRKLGNDLVCASLFSLPFRSKSFDQVICSEVIEHVPRDEVYLSEFHRVLKPGGILILGTPDYGTVSWNVIEWIYGKVMPDAYADEHITHYDLKDLLETLKRHGFDPLAHRYVFGSELIIKARKRSPT